MESYIQAAGLWDVAGLLLCMVRLSIAVLFVVLMDE